MKIMAGVEQALHYIIIKEVENNFLCEKLKRTKHSVFGMVQAWVAHFVTPLNLSKGYHVVLVWIRQVTMTRQDRTKITNNTTNNIPMAMVMEPLTRLAARI